MLLIITPAPVHFSSDLERGSKGVRGNWFTFFPRTSYSLGFEMDR